MQDLCLLQEKFNLSVRIFSSEKLLILERSEQLMSDPFWISIDLDTGGKPFDLEELRSLYGNGSQLVSRDPFGGCMTLSQMLCVSYPAYQVFTLRVTTIAKLLF